MPGSCTVVRRRCGTFALVIPVAASLTSLRCGLSPNSGHSSRRRGVEDCAGDGIAAAEVLGVDDAAGALPQAATNAQAPDANARRVR